MLLLHDPLLIHENFERMKRAVEVNSDQCTTPLPQFSHALQCIGTSTV